MTKTEARRRVALAALLAGTIASAAAVAPDAHAGDPAPAPDAAAEAAFEARLRELKLPPLKDVATGADLAPYRAEGLPEDVRRAAFARSYELFEAEAARDPVEDYARF